MHPRPLRYRVPVPRPIATTLGPQWKIIGQQLREARQHRGLSQMAVAATVAPGGTPAAMQTMMSRDENGLQTIPIARLVAYSDFYEWDVKTVLQLAAGERTDFDADIARQEYRKLIATLDGLLRSRDEQDLMDDAVREIIRKRYPHLDPLEWAEPIEAQD